MAYTVAKGDTLSGIAKKLGVSLSALEAANPQIKNYNVISVGQAVNAPGSQAAPAAGTTTGASGLSVSDAMSAYGYVYTVAQSIPELNTILQDAVAHSWTADKLTASIESSPWYMQHADTVRNLAYQQYSEPGTYAQNLANAKNIITLKAQALGRTIDDATAGRLALQTLTENASFDDQRLSQLVTNTTGLTNANGAYSGLAAQYRDHMTQVAQNYGVAYTDASMDNWVNQIESGANSLDGFESVMRARAKATYPPLADQIDAGMTVRDIADPYVQTMAKTLEVPQTEVTLNDPYIQKALTQRQPDGTATIQPLYQFTSALKKDPRYDTTVQARTDAYTTLKQIGADWGFTK